MMPQRDLGHLPTFEGDSKLVNIVVETSKGMRTKMKYEEKTGVFRAEKVLPVGLVFPFDFGFLPSTLGGDGDPLDVVVLSESGLPLGCVVLGRLVAVLECEQTQEGETQRNDRLVAMPIDAKSRSDAAFDSAGHEADQGNHGLFCQVQRTARQEISAARNAWA
jgi:inorganic pyrophosphatase